ncbi:hypothetical protein IEQ34_017159 [Dendrobium chrysotoxum]|uniref:RRM domain-containing protein n=1 Tax=Dendrobium chrysotoxum TaxID=161865 RepID=A0AAV7FT61_DENCH|nr:hypothetical protein IEQ34_017159 [Dendrobium chrysotoxum]
MSSNRPEELDRPGQKGLIYTDRPEAEFHLFIGCLAWAINERILEDAFKSCGEVIDAKVNNDQETGRSRGFSFIPFAMK